MGYQIDTVTIDAFRGINQPVTIDFQGKTTMIDSLNGAGKTSILRAIEFALFGDVEEMQGSDYSRNRLEYSNMFSNKEYTTVTLRLVDDNKSMEITRRTSQDSGGTTITDLTIDGTSIKQDKENTLSKAIGLDQEEFHLITYLTQSNFQKLLYYKPKERSEKFDKLLRTSPIRALIENYTTTRKNIETKQSTLDKRLKEQKQEQDRIKQSYVELKNQINDLNEELDQLDFDYSLEDKKMVLQQELTPYINSIPDSLEELLTEIKSAMENTTESKPNTQAGFSLKELINLRDSINDICDLLKKYESLQQSLDGLPEIEKLETDIGRLDNKLDGISTKIEDINKYTTFFEMAVNDVLSRQTKICPICENDDFNVSEIKAALNNKLQDLAAGNQLNNLKKQENIINNKLEGLQNQLEELTSLSNELATIRNKINTKYDELSTIKQFDKISFQDNADLQELPDLLNQYLEIINTEIDKVENQTEQTDRYATLVQYRDIIKLIIKIENLQKKAQGVHDSLDTINNKIDDIQNQRDRTIEALDILSNTQEYLTDKQQEYIEMRLNQLNPKISQYFTILTGHPVWNELSIDTSTSKYSGRYRTTYDLNTKIPQDSSSINLNAYFSQGQANRSILALIFAISQVNDSNLDFQLLDDITQSLDGEITSRLAQIVSKLSHDTQILVATSDERFIGSMQEQFNQAKVSHNHLQLGPWSQQGAVIDKIIPVNYES